MLAHESVTINETVHLTQIFLYLLANWNLWVCTTVWYLTCNCETLRAGLHTHDRTVDRQRKQTFRIESA
jgi:hypothetical protein